MKRLIGTLEKFKCNEVPAKQFRIMLMQVRSGCMGDIILLLPGYRPAGRPYLAPL